MRVTTAVPETWLRWAVCLALAAGTLAAGAGCSGGRAKGKAANAPAGEGAAGGDATGGDATGGDATAGPEPADAMAKDDAAGDDQGEWPLPEGVDPDTPTVTDDERIAVFSPTGWTRAAQSKDNLVKFVPSRRKTYPAIVVLAADAPAGIEEVEPEDQGRFVAAVAASLAKTFDKNGKSTLVKKAAPLQLGDHFGATWSAPATVKVDGVAESIDRVSYAVVLAGRMYTVEVRAPKGKLDENDGTAAARAVAAALRPPADIPRTADAPGFTPPPAEPAPAAE